MHLSWLDDEPVLSLLLQALSKALAPAPSDILLWPLQKLTVSTGC